MADGVFKPSTVPQLTSGVNLRQLPIGPEEAFLLSRVDGRTAALELSIATGIAQARVDELLKRLVTLGAVHYTAQAPAGGGAPAGDAHRAPEPQSKQPAQRLTQPIIDHVELTGSSVHPAASLYDPSELDVDVELSLPRKRRILDLYYQIDSLSYYQLLGVEPSADKKQIKAAYFNVVGVFHPDKYFGKRLGHFKPKLERVFQVLTEAHDTLTRNARRAEYDAYLDSQLRTRALDRMMSDERARTHQVTEARRRIEEQARVLDRAGARPPRASAQPPPQRRITDGRAHRPSAPPEAARGSAAPNRAPQGHPARGHAPPSDAPQNTRSAIQEIVEDGVRRRYDDRIAQARESHVAQYREAARQALAADDPVAAASSLRLAATLMPEDEALRLEYERVQAQAGASLAASYLSQAEYEARAGRFAEAAKSYEKAARGRPGDPSLLDHAAKCWLEAGTDLLKALDYARRAVVLRPTRSDLRITFARALLANKQPTEALGEIQQAVMLDPTSDQVQLWLQRIRSEV